MERPGGGCFELDDVLVDVVALRTFEGSQVEPGFGGLNAGQHHSGPTFGAWLRRRL
jgi:hypothetical protein